ncbi:MAG: GCN5-related N-acetyltransferase [Frankiales bacterium]|nr:GCN5-related N-acetyltransferase [Frankiales bacterium]
MSESTEEPSGSWRGIELTGLVLHSGRITLRPWQPGDAPAVGRIMADPAMHEHLSLPQPYTIAEAERYVGQSAPQAAALGVELMLAMAENTSGRVIGSIALRGLAGDSAITEIGYWVARAEWGQGYASEAVRTLTRFALAQGARRVEILTEITNLASAKVALRAGYSFEAVLRSRSPSEPADLALFARVLGDPDQPTPPAWPAPGRLDDGVVSLRAVTPQDAAVLLAENNNPESLRWSLFDTPMTGAEAVRRANRAGLDWLTGQQAQLVICESASGVPAGALGLRRHGPPGIVDIGYGVLPEFRGRRFTSRALELAADWLFSASDVQRLELGCKTANIASAKAAERAGFTVQSVDVGRLRNADGSYSDEIRFARSR